MITGPLVYSVEIIASETDFKIYNSSFFFFFSFQLTTNYDLTLNESAFSRVHKVIFLFFCHSLHGMCF